MLDIGREKVWLFALVGIDVGNRCKRLLNRVCLAFIWALLQDCLSSIHLNLKEVWFLGLITIYLNFYQFIVIKFESLIIK